jgi:histidinol dehydrogenase
LAGAAARVDADLLDAIRTAIEQVREYQQHVMPKPTDPVTIGGAELGLRFSPVDSVGLCVPGGTAVLFSTLIMLAVPAIVAGVDPKRISIAHPLPNRRAGETEIASDISPIVLAAAHMLGIDKVYRVGGAEGVAAFACGTDTIKPVDFIAGPGNVYSQLAKAQVNGTVGIDGFYGPSEIVTIADDSADPVRIAADLIAQAEHDPGKCFLLVWSRDVLDKIVAEVNNQIGDRNRREAIVRALENESCAVLVKDINEAAEVANRFAAEHVNLAVADTDALLEKVRHAGEVFLGDTTPVAAGDYYAGPSHCLPTGTTARFTSGISVYTFLKRTGTVAYRNGMPAKAIDHIARMAEAEGLDGHAHSARVRGGN